MPKDKDVPYFQFYPDDFASDGIVEAMTTEEVGAYILLLCKAWREKPVASIPNDDRVLARWARMDTARWAECREAVLRAFTQRNDGRLYQLRLEQEFQKLRSYQVQKSTRAAEAANCRWSKRGDEDASAMQTHSDSNADAMLGDAIPPPFPPPKNPTDSSFSLSDLVEIWNSLPDVERCIAINDKRRKAFKARMAEGDKWQWREALAKFPLPLYRNRGPDEWRPNIEWFLKPDTVTKILEGSYDWKPFPSGKPSARQINNPSRAKGRDEPYPQTSSPGCRSASEPDSLGDEGLDWYSHQAK